MKQQFRVIVRVEADVSSSKMKLYLTEGRVKLQVEKFLKGRSITEGLPCHGTSEFRVTECREFNESFQSGSLDPDGFVETV